MCEKPHDVCIDEGKWMIQAARKYNRIVVVGTQRRHGKGVAEAKKVVESGVLGKIHSMRIASYPQCVSGLRQDPGFRSAAGLRLRHVAGAGAQEAVHERTAASTISAGSGIIPAAR